MDKTISKAEIRKFLADDLRGKFFTIEFIKRTTGELRVMRATTNYKSYLAGGQPKYDFIEKNTLPVLDLEKQSIRSISLDAVLVIRALGNVYKVVE